jgi:hypothetical protein
MAEDTGVDRTMSALRSVTGLCIQCMLSSIHGVTAYELYLAPIAPQCCEGQLSEAHVQMIEKYASGDSVGCGILLSGTCTRGFEIWSHPLPGVNFPTFNKGADINHACARP